MTTERVTIKGTSNGLIINIGAGAWPRLMAELTNHLDQKASFFKGGRVALQVGPRQLTAYQLETVGELLQSHDMSLWAVEGSAPTTQSAAQSLGLEVELTPRQTVDAESRRLPAGDTIIIQRTVRSGQVINHPGNIVIIGDVNPGAEVRAGGSVIVWGRLRGIVHAGLGTLGDKAIVCAIVMAPTQLRINRHIARPPADGLDEQTPIPEVASVENDQIIAESWSNR